jgi:type I restriction enzyme S subunit
MRNCKTCKLKDVINIERDSVQPENIKDNTVFIGLEHIKSDGEFETLIKVQQGDISSNKFYFGKEHVLYGKLRPYLKKIARPSFEGVCSTDILPLKPKQDLDKDYLFYYLRQPEMIKLATERCSGANLPRLSPNQLLDFPITLPSLPEQKRITAILDKADAVRRKRQESIRLLDEFLRSVFLEMFGDPVRNEKGWEVDILGNRIKIISGYAFQSERFVEKGIPIIKIGTVNKGYFDTQILSYWPEQYEKKLEKYEVYPRDLLITLTGTVGKDDYGNVCLTNDRYKKYLLNQRVAKLICDHSLNKYYLLYCFKQNRFKNNLIKLSRGIRQANISNEDISNLNISIPPNELQDKFAQFVEKTEYQKEQFKKSLSEMENSFDSMMQKAFRGEL